MAISYFETAWNTAGTSDGGAGRYKDIVVTGAQVNDLIVVVGLAENFLESGVTRAIATQGGGGTTGAWTLSQPAVVRDGDVDAVGGYATVTGAGTVTIRVTLRQGTTLSMGVAAFLIPAAEKGASFAWLGAGGNGFVGSADGLFSATLTTNSVVIYAGADWNVVTLGTTTTPAGGTVRRSQVITNAYSVWLTDWANQPAATQNYGPSGVAGADVSGVVFRMDTVAHTDYTRTPADNAGLTDAWTVDMDVQRSATDAASLTDAVITVASVERDYSDSLGLTDASTVEVGLSFDDPLGATDSVSATVDADRTYDDALGMTDSHDVHLSSSGFTPSDWGATNATLAAHMVSNPADPLGMTDAVDVHLAVPQASEWGTANATLNGVTLGLSFDDDLGITDTDLDQTIDYHWSDDDALGMTDLAVPEMVDVLIEVSFAEVMALSDGVTLIRSVVRTPSDPLTMTDSVVVVMNPEDDFCWPDEVSLIPEYPTYTLTAEGPSFTLEVEESC